MKIGQISFMQMTEPASTPYGSCVARLEVPGPARPDAVPLLAELPQCVKILVTGGTGFIGPRVVHALRAQDTTSARSCAAPSARRTWPRSAPSSRPATSPTRRASARRSTGCTHVVHLVAIIKGSRRTSTA